MRLRCAAKPGDGAIADYLGEADDALATAACLSGMTGVIEHGLFGPALMLEVRVARGCQLDRITWS